MHRRTFFTGFAASALATTVVTTAQDGGLAARAAKHIKGVPYFAFGGVGYSGRLSEGESEFRVIAAQPPNTASQLFEIAYTGNLCAKCYALVALRKLNPGRCDTLAAPLLVLNVTVSTMEGCISQQQQASTLVTRIQQGQYDLWTREIHQAPVI